MADPVDLGDLLDAVRGAASAPGEDLFPDATEDDWLQRLANAFWKAFRYGFFRGYRETDFSIVPTTATVTLPREDQQIIVLFAAYDAIVKRLLGLATRETYRAPGVEATIERSSQLLQAALEAVKEEMNEVIQNAGQGSRAAIGITMFDNMVRRDAAALANAGVAAGVWVR